VADSGLVSADSGLPLDSGAVIPFSCLMSLMRLRIFNLYPNGISIASKWKSCNSRIVSSSVMPRLMNFGKYFYMLMLFKNSRVSGASIFKILLSLFASSFRPGTNVCGLGCLACFAWSLGGLSFVFSTWLISALS